MAVAIRLAERPRRVFDCITKANSTCSDNGFDGDFAVERRCRRRMTVMAITMAAAQAEAADGNCS